eukprot:8176719-Pyramimonas_sp.AAC.1
MGDGDGGIRGEGCGGRAATGGRRGYQGWLGSARMGRAWKVRQGAPGEAGTCELRIECGRQEHCGRPRLT